MMENLITQHKRNQVDIQIKQRKNNNSILNNFYYFFVIQGLTEILESRNIRNFQMSSSGKNRKYTA